MLNTRALPAYLQISEMLLREILAGRLSDGERFPPERNLAREFGVSVGTLRKALSELETQGHLERRQGSGNYVKKGDETSGVYGFFRLERITGGGFPTASMIDVTRCEKPHDFVHFGRSAYGFRIRRLRLLDDIPAALEEIWLDASYAETLCAGELTDSLYLHYRKALGFWITRAEDRIGVSPAPDWGELDATTCGYVERLSWAQDDNPVEYSRTWFNAGTVRYVSRLN